MICFLQIDADFKQIFNLNDNFEATFLQFKERVLKYVQQTKPELHISLQNVKDGNDVFACS